ncbi:MAG TPA: hypothetical protein VJX67_02640, partial [Blastocatellia bacterium]|nr:hypothetical protein [Blastocatellia bacterium]
ISIYGTALADATQNESTASLPVSLSGVSVSFDADGISQPGHLHFISPGQINVQIPWEFQGKSSVKIKVTIGDLQSAVYTLPLAAYSPALFPHGDFAAAQDANFADINPDHPARRGDVILLYANGLGAVSNQPRSGEPSGASETTSTPSVTIGGINAPVRFSGMTPDSVGLYQVNVMVPADAPTGNQQIVVRIGGVDSKPLLLPIQ